MFQNFKLNRSIRPVLNQCICKFSKDSDQSNLPAPPEQGSSKKVEHVEKQYDPKNVTKQDMQWRTPWHKKDGEYYSFLRTFYKEENNRSLLQWLQTDIDLSPSAVKNWWIKKKEFKEIYLQQYIPERNRILADTLEKLAKELVEKPEIEDEKQKTAEKLFEEANKTLESGMNRKNLEEIILAQGNELAAAHFVVYRGGSVKFFDEDRWIKADKNNEYSLPVHYQEGKFLQAIDCSDMTLHYEGLVNLRDLKQVEWLSLNGCEHMDDWCMDTISNIFSHSLVYLDLRNCPKISDKGIGALYKLRNLKILLLDDLWKSTIYEMVCLLLQEANPSLDIRGE